jgi:acyl-CoA reductase-like NAD-dependent aldehyde dehydrogenase
MNPSNPADVAEAIARAREAQPAWAALPVDARIRALEPVKRRLLARADEIGALLADECGKPVEEALLAEVLPNADLLEHWLGAIEGLLDPEEIDLDLLSYPGKEGRIHREASGVVALITPWNYPVAIPLRTLVPALLAGNAVVFKPSEVTPRAGALVASLFEGLLPYGVLGLLQGGAETGARLVQGGVDRVVFTGSARAGRLIAAACAAQLIPCSLELGGKDAAIILADADLERAARGVVWGAFTNAGQNCASVERVYVVNAVAEAFTKKVVALTAALRPGVDVGRMATPAQLAIVSRHVASALADGGRLLAGGVAPGEGDLFYPPTVIALDHEKTPLLEEETFGPVLPIVAVDSADEAITRANRGPYGLTASLWSAHTAHAEELGRRLKVGVVTINNHGFTAALPAAPWVGRGESGGGITSSRHALDELTRPRFVLVDRNPARSELWWYPYTPALRSVARAMATWRGGGGLVARWLALPRLVVGLVRRLLGG